MVLTEHQQEKFNQGLAILNKGSKRLLVEGEAGVGKTTLVNEMAKTLSGNIICSAPTQKAVSVLQEKVSLSVDFRTIHSALQYKRVVDLETGEVSFIPQPNPNNPPLKNIKYIFVDEASMIGVDMLFQLEHHASLQGTTVIFIGDPRQINPVKEKESPVFLGKPSLTDYETPFPHPTRPNTWVSFEEYPKVTLTEPTRQALDNPIIYLSRNMQEIFSFVPKHINHSKGYFYTENRDKIIEGLAEANGSDYFKYLAWSNVEVNSVNTRVRQYIYGNPNKIEKRETLVFNSPHKKFYNGQELLVEDLTIIEKEFTVPIISTPRVETQKLTLKLYVINPVEDFYNGISGIFVVHEESEKAFKKIVAILSKNGREKKLDFRYKEAFLSLFADFRYNHALTVHKSQGSTFRTTVLNVGSIMANRDIAERERILYTGITRPSELLILYNV